MYKRESLHIQLKYYRNQKGFSQTDVAEKLNLSRQAISNWEAGKSYPDLDNIILLSDLYEISVDELIGKDAIKSADREIDAKTYSEENVLGTASNSILETLCLAVILVLSCQFTVLGIITPIVITIWLKKNKRTQKIIYILCIICLIISLSNGYIMLENILNLGTSTIDPI